MEYSYNQSFIAEADCVVVCCWKKYPNSYEPLKNNCYIIDVIIAIDHLILTAKNYGVGSCWVGVFYPESIKKLLKIPEDIDIINESFFGLNYSVIL